ncbi:hypothetical protein K438DRAFT_2027318 [Mycena galopus ATCC 62051]|nr:hypothetical protein K438DRAFT_2027318 [Mycena galopus ATCC 62051]
MPSLASLTYSAFRTFPLLSLYPTVTEEVSNTLSLYPTVTEEFLFYYRHLEQCCWIPRGNPQASFDQTSAPTSHPRIKLDSLVIMGASDRSGIESWFEDPRCPFNVSRLKALDFDGTKRTLRDVMHAARETIKVVLITFFITPAPHSVNVSALRRITDIKITSFSPNVAHSFNLVRTIGQESRWHLEAIQLRILRVESFTFDLPSLMELDRQLCWVQDEFPNLKVVSNVPHLQRIWSSIFHD